MILVPPFASGKFEDTLNPPVKADFLDLKTACFYIDWDVTTDGWKFIIPADNDQLKENIERIMTILDFNAEGKINDSLNKSVNTGYLPISFNNPSKEGDNDDAVLS
jgi:hypothetical protein